MGFRKPPPPAQPAPMSPVGMQSLRDKLRQGMPQGGMPPPMTPPGGPMLPPGGPMTPAAPGMDLPPAEGEGGVSPEALDQAMQNLFPTGGQPSGVPPTPAPTGFPPAPTPLPRRGIDLEGKEPPNRPAPRPRGFPARPTMAAR